MEFFTTPVGQWPAVDLRQLAERRGAPVVAPFADAFVAHGAAAGRLEQLVSGEALCVTTGQQPGLFLGPLYTVYKALSAAAVAASFEKVLGRPVVPVFWVPGDDHDFAEANHLTLLGTDGEPAKIELRGRDGDAPSTPMYREIIGADIESVIAAVREALPATEFLDAALADLSRAYDPAADLAGAFATHLAQLLGDFGVVVFNPTAPSAKRAQADWLIRALERADDLNTHLAATAAQLEADGKRVPVRVGDGASLVMIEAGLGRDRLTGSAAGFTARRSGEDFSLADLQQVAADEPTRLSANVLLRPVVEAAIFPTLAYVGGPGELAYLGQCDPVYQTLGVNPQARLPRWSAVVIEHRTKKTLHKYGIAADDLAAPAGALETRLVGEDLPPEVTETLARIRGTVTEAYEHLGAAAVGIDPTLKKTVESARNQSLSAARDVEKKILTHLKQKNETMVRQIARARSELFPGGTSQERVVNLLQYTARYGDEFLRVAYESCRDYVEFETMSYRAE